MSTALLAPAAEITGRIIHCVVHSARSLFSVFLFVSFSKLAIFLSSVNIFGNNSYKRHLVRYVFVKILMHFLCSTSTMFYLVFYCMLNQVSITGRIGFSIQIFFIQIDLEAFLTRSSFPRTSIENKHNEKN